MALNPNTTVVNNVQLLDDEPNSVGGLTPAQLKATFDQTGSDLKDYLNTEIVPNVYDKSEVNTLIAEAEVGGSQKATQAEAEAGTDNSTWMTPLRVKQSIDANAESRLENYGVTGSTINVDKREYTLSNQKITSYTNNDVFVFKADENSDGIPAIDISQSSYASKSFSVSSQTTTPSAITFNNDGSKMYVLETGNRSVYQYSLSTAFDVDTASYDSKSFSFNTQDSTPSGIRFNDDGTTMFMMGRTTDTIYQYTLSTPYDVSTMSYASKSFSVTTEDSNPYGICLNNDGSKIYVVGNVNDTVYQYTMSTPYDIATASYDSVSLLVNQDATPTDIQFNSDGTKLFMLGSTTDSIYQYTLGTAYDLSTGSYDSLSYSVNSEDATPNGIELNNDDTEFYIAGDTNNTMYQYTLGYSTTPLTGTPTLNIDGLGAKEIKGVDPIIADNFYEAVYDSSDDKIKVADSVQNISIPDPSNLVAETSLTGSSVTISGLDINADGGYYEIFVDVDPSTNISPQLRINGIATSSYYYSSRFTSASSNLSSIPINTWWDEGSTTKIELTLQTGGYPIARMDNAGFRVATNTIYNQSNLGALSVSQSNINSITLIASGGTFISGTVKIYKRS